MTIDKQPSLITETDLRRILPPPSERLTLKIQPQLEATGRRWIEEARLLGLATQRPGGSIEVSLRAHANQVARAPDNSRILIRNDLPSRAGQAGELAEANPFSGAIFMLPGQNSTLRANGPSRASDAEVELRVSETFMHCPKAFVRSHLWEGQPPSPEIDPVAEFCKGLGEHARAFVARAPFLLLGTSLPGESADVSPRGDPPGFVHMPQDNTLLIPDRPGNNIADSFLNLLGNPQAGLLFLIPGVDWVLQVSGAAHLTTAREALAPMSIQGKEPKLAIRMHVDQARLTPAPALAAARIWELPDVAPRVPTLGRTIVDQVEPNGRFRELKGRLLERALRRDVKNNLY